MIGAVSRLDEPPINPREGNLVTGFAHIYLLRSTCTPGALWPRTRAVLSPGWRLRERERSRIGSLKYRYNQVFGYYIEVTKPHLDRVPADYERKQTLVSVPSASPRPSSRIWSEKS